GEISRRMSKIRINDLARELEVKSKAILDVLTDVGVTEKKTHSSSLELDEAERVRKHFSGQRSATTREDRSARGGADEIKTKIDLSKISKPGDVLAAIRKKTEAPAPEPAAPRPAAAAPRASAPVAKPVVAPPPAAPKPAPEAAKPAPIPAAPAPPVPISPKAPPAAV